jgi:hypothetical protein
MQLISTNDLSASGIAYSIVDTEVSFNDDGELSGYTEIIDELYWPGDGRSEPEREPLCDCDELRDDYPVMIERAGYDDHAGYWEDADYMSGRWAHIKDAHISEMLDNERRARVRRGDDKFDWRILDNSALTRERRVATLVGYMRQLALVARRRPEFVRRQADELQRGVCRRYAASVDLIIRRSQNEWWLLYLTKTQRDYLVRCVRRLRCLAKR